MSNYVMRGRAAIWGVVTESGDTHAAGLILSQGRQIVSESDGIADNEGFTITKVYFDQRDECDIDVICEAATAAPDIGDDIQIAGIDCIVESCDLKWQQKGWKGLNIKAKKYSQMTE